MDDIWMRMAHNLADRVSGPMQFRLILQPLVASIYAVRDGLKDAKTGKSPYLWTLISDSGHRSRLIKDGWKSVSTVFFMALAVDVIYQLIELRFVYPGEAILVALFLACPLAIIRGLVTRLARGRETSI
jgi:hypothetical protein